MICSKCNSTFPDGEVCPVCGESVEASAKIDALPPEEYITEDNAVAKSTSEIPGTPKKAPSKTEYAAFKRLLIMDIVKIAILLVFVTLPVLTPILGESLFEEFLEKYDRVFYNGIDPDPLVPVLLFLWGISIIPRLGIRLYMQIKKLSSFDAFYLEKFELDSDALYNAFTDGKSGVIDLILSIESLLVVNLTAILYGVKALIMSALPILLLIAAICLKMNVRQNLK